MGFAALEIAQGRRTYVASARHTTGCSIRARTTSTQQAESAPLEGEGGSLPQKTQRIPRHPMHPLPPAAGGVPDSMTARLLRSTRWRYVCTTSPHRSAVCPPSIVVVQRAPRHRSPPHSVCPMHPSSPPPFESRNLRGEETVHAPSMRWMWLGGSQKQRSDDRLMAAPTTPVRQKTVVCNARLYWLCDWGGWRV